MLQLGIQDDASHVEEMRSVSKISWVRQKFIFFVLKYKVSAQYSHMYFEKIMLTGGNHSVVILTN